MQRGGASAGCTDVDALSGSDHLPDAEKTILSVIRELLDRRASADVDVTFDSDLHEDLELDSLELAELSAALEDDLGRDPYSAGIIPRTVGEVVEFYR
jgi:acyl carrier protein